MRVWRRAPGHPSILRGAHPCAKRGRNGPVPRLGCVQSAVTRIPLRSPAPAARGRRDRKLVSFVARHGAVAIDHVMVAMGAGRTATYRRIAACAERGLLERLEPLRGEPSLLRATPEGQRYAGLGLPATPVSAGQVDHR